MTPLAVLSHAASLSIGVRVEGDGLRVKAPAGLPDDLRDDLVAHKSAILALLASESPVEVDQPSPSTWPPRPPELATWPLANREAWGRRADVLQDNCLHWRAAEAQASEEVCAARESR